MATTFYFHAATSTVGGTLPSTVQGTNVTNTLFFDAVTVNRAMDTTIGTAQTSLTLTGTATPSPTHMYVSRFISAPLNAQTISAVTWTYSDAAKASAAGTIWPGGVSNGFRDMTAYVWRPSTGANIGFLFDILSDSFSNNLSATAETSCSLTFTGSSVVAALGDVIVVEVLGAAHSTSSKTYTWYYDGTTANASDDVTVSNHASSISTTQTLAFQPNVIVCTVTGKSIIPNKLWT